MEFWVYLPIQLSPTTTSVIALLLFLYCFLRWKKSSNTRGNPPLPCSWWPIIGHLHLLGKLPHINLGELADKYGPILMIKLGVHQALVVSSADIAKECLSGKNDKVFLNRPKTIFVEHLGYDTAMLGFSPYGEYWREIRKIATIELLSNHQIETLKDVRISEVRSAMKILSVSAAPSKPMDLKLWFSDISLNTIVRLISGKSLKERYQGEDYNRFRKAVRDVNELAGVFTPADALPFMRWLDIGGYEKMMKMVAKQIDQMVQGWLDEHKLIRGSKQDFMDVLLAHFNTQQENPSKFDADTVIKATCMSMILAAGDTTAITLTWALSLLLNNKDVLKKTQVELDTFVGKERQVQESDLNNLVYLQAVLKETMRLYPAVPLSLPREAITDSTVSGYHIPAGTQLFVNLYKIQRDPQVWDEPSDFNPERFLTTHKDYDVRGLSYEFMPFGGGRRVCPGISFALQFMQFTLANLLHGFEVSLPSAEFVDMTQGFGLTNLKATPLEIILSHRLPQELYK